MPYILNETGTVKYPDSSCQRNHDARQDSTVERGFPGQVNVASQGGERRLGGIDEFHLKILFLLIQASLNGKEKVLPDLGLHRRTRGFPTTAPCTRAAE